MSRADELTPVLHVRACCGRGGGPDQSILSSARFLTLHGYAPQAAYLHPPGDREFDYIRRQARDRGIPLIAIPDRGPLSLKTLRTLEDLCRRSGVHIWHAHDYKSNLIGLLLRRRLGLALVTTAHGWVHWTWRTRLYFAVDRWCLRRYDRVIAVSEDLRRQCEGFGVAPARLCTIENAFDSARLGSSRAPRSNANGDRGARVSIGALGRLSREKGFDLLVRSVAELCDKGLDVDLRIAGVGSAEGALHRAIQSSPHRDRMQLVGFQEDVATFLSDLDIFALPSRREGLPQALIEALASGVAAVASRTGGVPEMVQDGESGLLVDLDDPRALTLALTRLVEDPNLRERLGEKAASDAASRFTFPRRAARLAAIYDLALSGLGESA